MRIFQSRCCSICILRYFTLLEILILWRLIRELRYLVICFRLDLDVIISVLSAFRFILYDLNRWTTREMIIYVFVGFFIVLFEYRRFVSSCLTDLWRSLIKMIHNRGLNTDPSGTPWVTKYSLESKPHTDVYCTFWDKNDRNQLTAWPLIP